jgi:hypothetical protein
MKRIVMIGFSMMMGYFAFGQRVISDPSYSVNNYKHPNKAAYARKHGLDRLTKLNTVSVMQRENYKQPYSATKATQKYALFSSMPREKSNSSYKHPYGL